MINKVDELIYSILGSVITLALFLAGVIYKVGHHSARLESLETWRTNMRMDMHEISIKLESISNQISNLATIVEERTERRNGSVRE